MRLSNRPQIEALARFRSPDLLAASLYLDTDKGRLTKKEIVLSFKNLIQAGRAQVEALRLSKVLRESLARDLDRMAEFGTRDLGSFTAPGLALFSCSGGGVWEVLELPHGPRNRVILDHTFYVTPLSAILDRYRRLGILLVGRREAKWYEVFMGEIALLKELESDVPGKVRAGGFKGYDAKVVERHFEAHLQEHLKKAARLTFDLFKDHKFDSLVVGCVEDDLFPALEPHLHAYLKERLRGRLKAKPADPPSKVLKDVQALETELQKTDEDALVARLTAELERGGRAASGLKDILHRLNQFEVQTLVVTHGFMREGRLCPSCRILYADEAVCPVCKKPTEYVPDVVDEAIQEAHKRGVAVRHVTPPSRLDHYGGIGAFLKFKA